MKIKIVCVGNIKEKYYCDAVNEYVKRLSRFVNVEIVEIKEEKLVKNFSESDIINVKNKEAIKILENIAGFVVVCDKFGKSFSSEQFAAEIKKIENINSVITFVIGSSYGTSQKVLEKANLIFKFSDLTFPHQLFRVMLLEQIYRAYTILNNITYHK